MATIEEENCFLDIVDQVRESIQKEHNISDEEVTSSVEEYIGSYNPYSETQRFWHVELNFKNICGYLHHNGAFGAGIMRYKTLKALRNCDKLKNIFMKNKKIEILNLGGGPGNDILGFCSALYEFFDSNPPFKQLVINNADKCKNWITSFEAIKEKINSVGAEAGNTSLLSKTVDLELHFIPVDLLNTNDAFVSADTLNAFGTADIVLIGRLFSILESDEQRNSLVHIILGSTRKDVIIVNVDYSKCISNGLRVYHDDNTMAYEYSRIRDLNLGRRVRSSKMSVSVYEKNNVE